MTSFNIFSSSQPNSSTLPKKILILLIPLCIFHDMDITLVFSFAPKMIKSFGTSEQRTGYYAGLLGSSIYIGFFFFSLLWSDLGDVKGKKVSMIISSSCLAACVLAFGFSCSFTWAYVTRLLQGCSFGAVNVSKAVLREYLDDSNMALGMSIITLTGTIGLVLGPAFAGVTVFPVEQYPKVFANSSFLHEFPVFIPNAALFAAILISVLLIVVYMPESNTTDANEYSPLLENDAKENTEDQEIIGQQSNNSATTKENWRLVRIFKMKDCIVSCVLYGLLGFSATAFHELYPLLASTSIEYHGMAMTTSEIGVIFFVAAALLLVIQIPVLTKVTNLLGAKKTFCWSAVLQGIIIPLIPAIAEISNKVCLQVLLCTHVFLFRLLVQASFLTVTILINNTTTSALSATVNGLGFTFAAIGRILSPLVFGTLYAWSLGNVKRNLNHNEFMSGFPVNQYFPFLVWSFVSVFMACVGTILSKNADKKNNAP